MFATVRKQKKSTSTLYSGCFQSTFNDKNIQWKNRYQRSWKQNKKNSELSIEGLNANTWNCLFIAYFLFLNTRFCYIFEWISMQRVLKCVFKCNMFIFPIFSILVFFFVAFKQVNHELCLVPYHQHRNWVRFRVP